MCLLKAIQAVRSHLLGVPRKLFLKMPHSNCTSLLGLHVSMLELHLSSFLHSSHSHLGVSFFCLARLHTSKSLTLRPTRRNSGLVKSSLKFLSFSSRHWWSSPSTKHEQVGIEWQDFTCHLDCFVLWVSGEKRMTNVGHLRTSKKIIVGEHVSLIDFFGSKFPERIYSDTSIFFT